MKNVPDPGRDELFVGALELAMLDLIRQEYLDNEDIQYLFVVDFPRMAHVHFVPPLNLSMPEITGLLPSPLKPLADSRVGQLPPQRNLLRIKRLADEYPETLGLAEVLSRFVFDPSWSAWNPKLMLSTQAGEAGTIEDALRSQSIGEWSRSVSKTNIRSTLDKLAETNMEKGLSAEDFINEVATKAEELLPAIYGDYSNVRQFLRFEDIKPFAEDYDERPVWFAQQVSEIRPYLEEISRGRVSQRFRTLQQHWEKSIPDTSRRQMPGYLADRIRVNRRTDVDTLSTIEYVNERLSEDSTPLRLVYLTDDDKLFKGAAKRFGVVEDRTKNFKADQALGRPSAFHRSRYCAYLLRAGPEDKILDLPLLDPRVLMTGRRFVDFSVARSKADESVEPVRAITEWLPMFFDGAERDRLALANTYLTIQQHGGKDEAELKLEMFEQRQYDALKLHWSRYVRTVGTAHGLMRYAKRDHLRQLILAVVKGDRKAMERAVHAQLDRVMSAWLPAVGGATLLHRQAKSERHRSRGIERVRSVPPLLLPAWPVVQKTLIDLFGGSVVTEKSDAKQNLRWLTKPTVQNLGLDVDRKAPQWRINYIHSLGLAYGFACEGNWAASYRLATSAYSLAEVRGDGQDSSDEHFISGREAAFLASLSARRSLASRPHYFQASDIEYDLLGRLRKTLAQEDRLFDANGWDLRKAAHELRLAGEALSWQVYRLLSSIMKGYLRNKEGLHGAPPVIPNALALQSETWATYTKILQLRDNFTSASKCDARHDYRISVVYLGRQVVFNLLQLEIFGHLASGQAASKGVIEALRQLIEALIDFAPTKVRRDDVGIPWSCYENSVIQRAISIIKKGGMEESSLAAELDLDDRKAADGIGGQHLIPMQHSLSEWRLDLLEPNWRSQVVD